MGWYNSSWKYRQKITVPSGKVSSNLTDYPVYVKLDNLPRDFWLNVKSAGADIRVTSSDGTTELPREVVSCNTTTKKGELHFKATGTLNSGSDNIFYVYYGNAAASDYSVSATYGRNNVWTADFEIVAHFEEDPDTQSFVNSVGTATGTYTNTNGLITGTGAVGNACDFSGGNAGQVVMGTITESDRNYAFSAFAKMSSNSSAMAFFEYSSTGSTVGGRRVAARYNSSRLNWNHNNYDGSIEPAVTINTNTWYHMSVNATQVDSTHASVKCWIDGANQASHSNYTSIDTNGSNCIIGANRTGGEEWDGAVDELRYYKAYKSDAWMLAESSNLRNPTAFYTVGATEHETSTSNWYNASWLKRVSLTIDATKVNANLTDFPLLVDLSILPAGFFTSVKSAGEDIRVTLGDGVTEIPVEVVAISTGGETGEIYVKHPYLSDYGGDSIFIYFANSAASAPSVSSTYGRNNVWNSNFSAVFHLQDAVNNNTDGYTDSTSNAKHGTGTSMSISAPTGKIGKGQEFDGVADYITNSNFTEMSGSNNWTKSCWAMFDNTSDHVLIGKGNSGGSDSYLGIFSVVGAANKIAVGRYSGGWTYANWGTTPTTGTWYKIDATYNGSQFELFINGSSVATAAESGSVPSNTYLYLGRPNYISGGGYHDGKLDEVRISNIAQSAAWISTEYNNQNANNTFYTVGSIVTGDTAPTISTLTPADNATNVSVGANLVIVFSENVTAGSGNILIKKTSDNSTMATIPVGDAQVSISGDTVTINPTSNLAYSTSYYVQIANTCFVDSGSNAFAGISDTTTWNFTTEDPDITAPTLSSSTPADNATGVSASANIVLNFSENVFKGTGNILIKNYADDTTIETIDVTSGLVTISSAAVTINPASNLPNAAHVYLIVPNTAFKDASDNYYAGIATKTVLDFTVADTVAPVLVSSSPVAGAIAVQPDTTITLTFDEAVVKGTGNITIKKYADDTTIETIAVGAAAVAVTSNVVVITPSANLAPDTKVYILVANTCFKDSSNNAYAGLTDNDDLSFTTVEIAIETLTPAEGATGVDPAANLELDFNQDVSANSGNITISQRPNLKIGGSDFSGDVGEILVIRDSMTTDERKKAEGYLAWRWFGATNPLPTNHPYKYRSPTI